MSTKKPVLRNGRIILYKLFNIVFRLFYFTQLYFDHSLYYVIYGKIYYMR